MKPCQIKPIFILLLLPFILVILGVIFGCNNSDSSKTENVKKNVARIVGTWQQTAIGEEEVSGIVVKIIFSDRTMTMDAPGCLIIADYTTDDKVLTFTITSTQGERCSKDQAIGKSDSVYFDVTDSQLILTPLLAGKDRQSVYKRVD